MNGKKYTVYSVDSYRPMSTNFCQYVFLGVRVPYDNDTYDQYAEYDDNQHKEPRKGLTVLYDGRDGRFTLIGTIVYRSDINESIDGPLDLSEIGTPLERELLATLVSEKFGISSPDIKVWLVTMYT